tara:strand:+ start:1176 stop:2015 length:840 start_codon:yes stop_codon:yes gene_type:complete
LKTQLRIGVLGVGNMANAFVKALNNSVNLQHTIGMKGRTIASTYDFIKTFPDKAQIQNWYDDQLWQDLDYWVLAVKPNQIKAASSPLINALSQSSKPPVVVSLMAGVSISELEQYFPGCQIIKVMANLGIAKSKPMFAISAKDLSGSADTYKLFDRLGECLWLNESKMHAATAILGSGPALFMAVQDEMLKAGSKQGLTPEEANFLSQGALVGAANMMTAHTSPEAMINKIKSPGGTTEKALTTIKTGSLLSLFGDAIDKACERSQEISRSSKFNENSD